MATGMAANASFRGDRRGPVQQGRHGGRNNFNTPRHNNARRGNHQINTQLQVVSPSPLPGRDQPTVYENERFTLAVMHMMGHKCFITTANGTKFEGVLTAMGPQCDLELKEARLFSKDGVQQTRNTETIPAMLFEWKDVVSCATVGVVIEQNNFTDTAISRSNGAAEGRETMKQLVAWEQEGDESLEMTLETADGSNGWDADEMFKRNREQFNLTSSYDQSLASYTMKMPEFKTEEEKLAAERRAAKIAKEIESSDGYKRRMDLENDENVDEETRFSSVVRPASASTSTPTPDSSGRAYVPPARRHHEFQPPQRGAAQGAQMPSHQPLPQRERRGDRDRGDREKSDRSAYRNAPPPSQPQGPPVMGPNSKDSSDRRPDSVGRGSFSRLVHQGGLGPHHNISSVSNAQHPAHQGPSQQTHGPPPLNNFTHLPPPVPGPHVPNSASPQGPPTQLPHSSTPSVTLPVHGSRGNAPTASVSTVQAAGASQSVVTPSTAAVVDLELAHLPAHNQQQQQQQHQQQQQQQPAAAIVQNSDKKSPRDRQDKLSSLKAFSVKFKLHNEGEQSSQDVPHGRRAESEENTQNIHESVPVSLPPQASPSVTPQAAPAVPPQAAPAVPPQAAPAVPAVSSQGTTSQPLTSSQGTSAGESETTLYTTSTLNPNATEFRPRQQQPALPVVQVASPGPAGTPPAQGLRQSPGMIQQTLVPYGQSTFIHRMPPVGNQGHPQPRSYQPPKRAVVSVDPAALAPTATGQPLTLGPQAPAVQPQSFVYAATMLPQAPTYHPMQVRMMQSIPQGAGMDHTLGATGQTQHVPQQFIMAQQPVPAHMPTAQPLAPSMPQPAHTIPHQHHQHQQALPPQHGVSNMPPSSQNNVAPMPAASPVQHMGGNGHNHGPPQMNHNQGAPPTSNTPQSGMFGHQMSGMLPPQGAAAHAMPAHTVAQGPTPTLQFLHHQHQMQGAVAFSQAGAAAGGPTPAHVTHSAPTTHLLVMPQPPSQAINQAPINNPQHQHQQHHQQHPATAAFQQHLQGAASQLHGPVGHNQHLMQGGVPAAGASMGMHQSVHPFLPTGVQGPSHTPHQHPGNQHTGGHSHSHGHGHGHPQHPYQGQ